MSNFCSDQGRPS